MQAVQAEKERAIAALEALAEVYAGLLDMAKEKAEALKGRDPEAVGRITDREQLEAERAREIEEGRMRAMGEVAKAWGVEAESLSAEAFIARLEGAEKARAEAAAKGLGAILRELKKQNDRNAQVIEIRLRVARFVLEAGRSEPQGPGNYYGMDGGELDNTTDRPRFIDSEI